MGIVGRLFVSKGLDTFLEAATSLTKERHDLRFVIVGDGPDNRRLQGLSEALGLTDRLVWTGAREDMPAVYNGFDILCSASVGGEGFPNVIAEAMACGVPCVVTDVGDSKKIVDRLGVVVRAGDPLSLANGLGVMLLRLPSINRVAIREHIVKNFSLEAMVEKTENALLEICELSEVGRERTRSHQQEHSRRA